MTRDEARDHGQRIALRARAKEGCKACQGTGQAGKNTRTQIFIPCACTGLRYREWELAWKKACARIESRSPGPSNNQFMFVPRGGASSTSNHQSRGE